MISSMFSVKWTQSHVSSGNSPSERQISRAVSCDFDDLCCKQTLEVRISFLSHILYLYKLRIAISSSRQLIYFPSLSPFENRIV